MEKFLISASHFLLSGMLDDINGEVSSFLVDSSSESQSVHNMDVEAVETNSQAPTQEAAEKKGYGKRPRKKFIKVWLDFHEKVVDGVVKQIKV